MKNRLDVGLTRKIALPKGSFLYLGDEVPEQRPKSKVFNPFEDGFDPLDGITKKAARDLARALYANSPEGASTLTVRNGRRALASALSRGKRLDELEVHSRLKGVREEVEEMVDELLFTDVARECLCSGRGFAFTGHNTKVFARLNRVELGDDDALAIGLFLLSHYKGQIIIEDGGFYLRDMHSFLLRENRLMVGVNHLGELPPRLRAAVLLVPEKPASGAIYQDAVELAKYDCEFPPGTNEYNAFIERAMA